jgi:hypothetical protein
MAGASKGAVKGQAKGKAGASKGKKGGDNEREDTLQAVVCTQSLCYLRIAIVFCFDLVVVHVNKADFTSGPRRLIRDALSPIHPPKAKSTLISCLAEDIR